MKSACIHCHRGAHRNQTCKNNANQIKNNFQNVNIRPNYGRVRPSFNPQRGYNRPQFRGTFNNGSRPFRGQRWPCGNAFVRSAEDYQIAQVDENSQNVTVDYPESTLPGSVVAAQTPHVFAQLDDWSQQDWQ
jgi:hypothetical protein